MPSARASVGEWLGEGPSAAPPWERTQPPAAHRSRSGRRERLEKTYQLEALPPCRDQWATAPKFGSPGLAAQSRQSSEARMGQGLLPPVLSSRPPLPSLPLPIPGHVGSAGQAVSSAREMVSGDDRTVQRLHPSPRLARSDGPHSARELRPPPDKPARTNPRRAHNSPSPGILADRHEAKGSYNSVDPGVCQDLNARVAALVREHEGVLLSQATGIYLLLEHCHSCSVHHALTTRHDEHEYESRAKSLLAQLLRASQGVVLGGATMPCRLDASTKCLGTSHALGQNVWHQASRVGAFEIYLLTPALEPEPVDEHAIVRLPKLSNDLAAQVGEDRGPGSGQGTWGACARLPGGHYMATLLHSKLCANSWPKQEELTRRLITAMPLGSATIRVLCPSGRPLSGFSVAVHGTLAAAGGREGSSLAEGSGVEGSCRVEGVPLRTELELRVAHPTMADQTVRFSASCLRAEFTFGTDIVFNLWTLEVPGGLVVYASDPEAHPSHIPEKATPFHGDVEMDSGEQFLVRGSMRLPWKGFQTVQEGVLAAAAPRRAAGSPGRAAGGRGAQGARGPAARGGPTAVLGCDFSDAADYDLPSLAQMRTWLPPDMVQPSAVLRRSPCRVVLQAVEAVLSVLQNKSKLALSFEGEQLSAFALVLDKGLKLLYTYTRAFWERWQNTEEDADNIPSRKVCERVLQESTCQEIDELCGKISSNAVDAGARSEVERFEGGQQGHSRGEQLAGACVRASCMKPWLDKICTAIAQRANSSAVRSSLKGTYDCTRVFEKMTLRPEWGPPWDLLSCAVVCPSLGHVLCALQVAAELLGPGSEASLLEVRNCFKCGEIPWAKQGAVRLYVAWKESASAPPAVGEIQLVHQAFFDEATGRTGGAASERGRFFAELLERKRCSAPVQAEVEPVELFSTLRKIFVEGYHSTELELKARSYPASIFRQQECLELAMLASPRALLRVVAPGRGALPLGGVRVQVETELQHTQTDDDGWCQMLLRPGRHVLKLRHDELSSRGWVERELSVDCLSPRFQVPLPATLAVWRSPVVVRGDVCAWRVWLAPRMGGKGDDEDLNEPFTGVLRDATGAHLQAEAGRVTVEAGPVEPIEAEPAVEGGGGANGAAVLLRSLALDAPFARRASAAAAEEAAAWQPQLLGCRPEGPLLPSATAGAGALAARARTLCCGVGVAGVQLELDAGCCSGSPGDVATTDAAGVCVLPGVPFGVQAVRALHPALGAEGEVHEVCAGAADEPAELPLFFDARIQLFLVPGPNGRQVLQALAGGAARADIDPEAQPFVGRLVGNDDWELRCKPQGTTTGSGGLPPLEFATSRLKKGRCCPILPILKSRPHAPGFEWQPAAEVADAVTGPCGLQHLLLSSGPVTLGTLRPVAEVVHVDGRSLTLPVEECPTVGALTARLQEDLGLTKEPLALALADAPNDEALEAELQVRGGQRLRVLARLQVRVTFGRSEIGVPGASVWLDEEEEALARRTGGTGGCALLAAPGSHSLAAAHPLLGGVRRQAVELRELSQALVLTAPAAVCVALRVPPAGAGPAEPCSVWLCALPAQLPDGAEPVAGTLRVPAAKGSGDDGLTLELDTEEIRPLELQPPGGDGDPTPPLPAPGVELECRLGARVWRPDAPLLLNTAGGWRELLQGPVRAGLLEPPVLVRCHLPGAAAGAEPRRLPAGGHGRAGAVRRALAPDAGLPEEALGIFLNEVLLDAGDSVSPWCTLDLWPVAPLTVRARTRCCWRGLAGVSVLVSQDYLLSGRTADAEALAELLLPGIRVVDEEGRRGLVESGEAGGEVQVRYEGGALATKPCESLRPFDPSRTGSTDFCGECCVVVNAGGHHVHLAHPLLAGCKEAEGERLRLAATTLPGRPLELLAAAEPLLCAYASVDGPASGEAAPLRVWLCARAQDLPPDARPIKGVLRVPGGGGEASITFDGAAVEPWRLPEDCLPSARPAEAACPLWGLALEPGEGEMLAWCPEEPSADDAAGCLHGRLASGPLTIGVLRPAVAVALDGELGARRRKLPAGDFASLGALRRHLAEELGRPEGDVAVFTQSDRTWGALDDDMAIVPGQELYLGLIAPLVLQVSIPEGLESEGEWAPEPLPGVYVELDGVVCGETDADGCCEVRARCGQRYVRLRHGAFGQMGRLLPHVEVEYGARNERAVLADVRVYLYATDPEPEEEEEGEGGEEEEGPPLVEPGLVWACCARDQIPEGAFGFAGRISGQGAGGSTVSLELSTAGGPGEFVLLAGEEAEAAVEAGGAAAAARCSLGTLALEARREGHLWRPKDPLPIVERAQELGGSEYLRLLGCPMVMGFFDPTLKVEHASSPPFELPVKDYPTSAAVKEEIQERLGIPAAEMVLFQGEERLADSVAMTAGMQLKAVEVATLSLRTVTSCCQEPIGGVEVTVDGKSAGTTDSSGYFSHTMLVGEHSFALQHTMLGQRGRASRQVSVSRNTANDLVLPLDPRLYVYATDPEEEEEEAEAEDGEEYCPMYDPSCVWLAADPSHIPEDARPLEGCATCPCGPSSSSGGACLLRARLSPQRIAAFELGPGALPPQTSMGQAKSERCFLGALSLRCRRDDFFWAAKEPSPLAERLEELGGCELLRLAECPVALGFLKPAVTVHCAAGRQLVLPLDACGELQALRTRLAEELGAGEEAAAELQLEVVEGGEPLPRTFLKGPARLLCALPGESLADARTAEAAPVAAGEPVEGGEGGTVVDVELER